MLFCHVEIICAILRVFLNAQTVGDGHAIRLPKVHVWCVQYDDGDGPIALIMPDLLVLGVAFIRDERGSHDA